MAAHAAAVLPPSALLPQQQKKQEGSIDCYPQSLLLPLPARAAAVQQHSALLVQQQKPTVAATPSPCSHGSGAAALCTSDAVAEAEA
eukprot:CAMPEP_0178395636 /NCGR_PEP_ID=MMETSP0689_2-20121128/13321_1 /TAXON_ID=160604 /ORGANISM="Amphidinium massartii, Strain CS-259" /LENGTH=86 /DNA_ID=CAMNT_0020016297 /DNA_START=443 /DNA_END=703 /DNA_ORIENTATION=+